MSFAQLYQRYADKLRPAHKGEVHTVMATGLRSHEDKWNGNGWAIDFVDGDGKVGSIAAPFVRTNRDNERREMAWLLVKALETICQERPAPELFVVEPNASWEDTRIRGDASKLVKGAVIDVKASYIGKDWTDQSGNTRQGDVSWDLVAFRYWHQDDGPDAAEDANANATTGDRSTPEGGYGSGGGGGYGAHPDDGIPFAP